MAYRELEQELFKEWQKRHLIFIEDGIVNEEEYVKSDIKILYLLKEVNAPNDTEGWDLRKVLLDGGRPMTWRNIARWTEGIRRLEEDLNWTVELDDYSEGRQLQHVNSICAMNVKKTPGGNVTINGDLWSVALEDADLFKKQFKIYEADLVICCGSVVSDILFNEIIIPFSSKNEWETTKRGVWYYEYKIKKYIIAYSHPEARVSDNILYYGLVDAVKEILNR